MPRRIEGNSPFKTITVVVALLVSVAFDHRSALAEPRDVEALIGEGMELRRQGKDERALPFFQKAYGIEHAPRTAGQLGLAEMAVGYWLSSESHLTEALDSPGHPWIAKNQATLASALERVRRRIGEVALSGSPTGARVVVNGQEAGTLPLSAPIRVGEGRVQVELSARGYVSAVRTFRLAGGSKEQLTLALVAEPPKPAEAVASSAAPGAAGGPSLPDAPAESAAPSPAAVAADVPRPSPTERAPARAAAYVAGGAAIAALAFAVVETVRWQNKETEFDNHIGAPPLAPAPQFTRCGEADPGRGATGCAAIYDQGKLAWRLSLVGYGVGGLLAAGAIYLYVTGAGDQQGTRQSKNSTVTCLPSVDLPQRAAAAPAARMNCQLSF